MSPGVLYLVYDIAYFPRYFSQREFHRVGCDYSDCDSGALAMLDSMRIFYGKPIILTSAFRTPERNKLFGGTPNSAHLRGLAFDLRCTADQRYDMVHCAILAGFTRIGIGNNFIHVDCDETLPSPRIWTY